LTRSRPGLAGAADAHDGIVKQALGEPRTASVGPAASLWKPIRLQRRSDLDASTLRWAQRRGRSQPHVGARDRRLGPDAIQALGCGQLAGRSGEAM